MDDDDHEADRDSSNSSSRRSGDQPESEKDSDVGGVWIVGNVEELEDEKASDALSEDGADQRDGFRGEEHASARGLRVSDRNNFRRKRVRRKARVDEIGSSH